MMRAVVLAAGTGSRLLPLTSECPKALVEVGGEPLLTRMLSACATAGVSEAVVVTGHLRDRIEAFLGAATLPLPVRTVFNDAYATLGNAHSLWVAAPAVAGGDFIKLDGDLLLSATLLSRLVAAPWPSAALCDAGADLDAEAMKAEVRSDGTIAAFGKWLMPPRGTVESIGVERIAAADAPALFDAIDEYVHQHGEGQAYYEDVYQELIARGWRIGCVPTAGVPWTEIDDLADLARARDLARTILR